MVAFVVLALISKVLGKRLDRKIPKMAYFMWSGIFTQPVRSVSWLVCFTPCVGANYCVELVSMCISQKPMAEVHLIFFGCVLVFLSWRCSTLSWLCGWYPHFTYIVSVRNWWLV